jgi:hypothetical protein
MPTRKPARTFYPADGWRIRACAPFGKIGAESRVEGARPVEQAQRAAAT